MRFERLASPFVVFLRSPHLCRKDFRLFVLHYPCGPCRYAFALSSVPVHAHLIEVSVLQGILRQRQFPVLRPLQTFGFVFLGLLPVVEISYQIYRRSVGRPLPEHPSLVGLVQSEIEMSTRKVSQRLLSAVCQLGNLVHHSGVSAVHRIGKRTQIFVVTQQFQHVLFR